MRNVSEEIIARQPERVQQMFVHWEEYMERHMVFWEIPGEFDIHTQGHCERVLMHALRIGEARGLPDRALVALAHAAIFHDTRRKDNYLDVGHGGRAALYYREFCACHDIDFCPEAFNAVKFHDRDDDLGIRSIRRDGGDDADGWLEVYRCFKDADALDRLRLGTWCLDVNYLRTPEAKTMTDFAEHLVRDTIDPDELAKMFREVEKFRNS